MAKEMMIVFVYDTELVQKEEDDPASAILYFYPTWVSDQQKAALCGQLMGTIKCLKSIFTIPKIVSLQSGKFHVIENGRYLLAIGTDRNIADWLLEYRANILYSLVNFFHKDFLSLAESYQNTETLSAKLYYLFETYLKMMFLGGNLFSHIPSLSLPKSASNVFTEAIQIMQYCQDVNHVLGGCMLYHNKVVATHLSPDLTKRLVLTDPYRIKCPAETAEVSFELPLGVQLLDVYISSKEYHTLLETTTRNRNIFQYLNNKSIKKRIAPKVNQDPILLSAMKRDQSLIFTAVPEETDSTSPAPIIPVITTTKRSRPKFLNLKCISIDSISNNIEMKPMVTRTPLAAGPTSICSTPMTELKKFVHHNPMSICHNNAIDDESEKELSGKWSQFVKKFVPYVQINNNNIYGDGALKHSNSSNFLAQMLDEEEQKKLKKCKTISDPTFPVFKADGTIVSHPFYQQYLEEHLKKFQQPPPVEIKRKFNPFDKFDSALNNVANKSQTVEINANDNKHNYKEKRKSLTLPLKSLTTTDEAESPIAARRYSCGVQLTPLMSKLSMLAFEEKSSGFGSYTTTPSVTTPTFSFAKSFPKKPEVVASNQGNDDSLQKCTLFVCGQQDVVLLLLLKEECVESPEVIRKLWEVCTEELARIEKQLHYCMESCSTSSTTHSDNGQPYSFLSLDRDWGTVQRGGPWGTSDQGALSCLHRDFTNVGNITEILVRGSDNVIYGSHCGQVEVYYHESAATNAGLPTPADSMGLVQLKAKRRLERDHAVILL